MITLFLICAGVVLSLLFSWISVLINKQGHNVRGPFPLPVIGNGYLFVVNSTEILNLLAKLSKTYGEAFLVYFLTSPHVIISHPKYVESLVTDSEFITKGNSYEFLRPWLGNGLLTSSGLKWRNQRKFLTAAFHFNILQNFVPIFSKNGRKLTDKLDQLTDGQDLFPIVALTALDNATEAVMGLSVDSQKNVNSDYVKYKDVITQTVSRRMQIPLLAIDWIFNLSPDKKTQDKAIQFLHNYTKNVIATRRNILEKMKISRHQECKDLGIKKQHTFLDLLLLAEEGGQGIDVESIREEVDTFMIGGLDSTTAGICYILYCVSKHPDVEIKLLEEQESIFGDEMDRDPTFTDINKMKYLELVIKESLRLYPPVPLIERKIMRDIKTGELKLKQGTSVIINIFQMQRNPTIFEDPLEFRPERFDTSSSDTRNAFSFLVFSAGPRNCIAQRFAMMQMKVTLSQIVRRLKLRPVEQEPELCADLTLKSKNGIKVIFLRRQAKKTFIDRA